jgi:general secretion pathway protein I
MRGFSLLEVLVALAILGLGLTTILSAQAGLFSTSARSANMTSASNLARCKMSEIELLLMRDGYPLSDEKDEGRCCEREDDNRFTCRWMVETIKLPPLDQGDGGTDGGLLGGVTGSGLQTGGGLKLDAELNPNSMAGKNPLDILGQAMPGLGMGTGTGSSSDPLGSVGLGGLATMVLPMVYPTVKPMFEASIRRVSVSVRWKEGINTRNFDVAQYVTNPQQGGMLPGMPGFIPDLSTGIPGMGSPPASPASPANTAVR